MLELIKRLRRKFYARQANQQRQRAYADARHAPGAREQLPFRLAYVYKDNAFDVHSREMALHLLRQYEPVAVIGFGEAERRKGETHLTTPRLIREIEEFRPDAILAFDKFFNPAEAAALTERGILLTATNDGFASFDADVLPQDEAVGLLRKFGAYFVAHAPHVERLRQEGIPAEAFPLWADTELFRPLGRQPDIDVLFIGTSSGNSRAYRQPLLRRVAETARLTVAGPREHFRNLPGATLLGPVTKKEEINELYNRSRLVLGFDRLADEVSAANQRKNQTHFYNDVTFQIKDRTTCVMASGACYLVEDHEENRRLFRAGEELVLWRDADDLVAKIRHYLDHPGECRLIGERARARVVADYSVDVRARQAITRIEELLKKPR